VRVELGPKDIKNNQIVAVRRDTGEKIVIPRANAAKDLAALLDKIHDSLLERYIQLIKIQDVLGRGRSSKT